MKLLNGLSSFSDSVDILFYSMIFICGLVTLILLACIVIFCFKFHYSKQKKKTLPGPEVMNMEYTWIAGTMFIFLGIFAWSTHIYKSQVTPVKADYHVYVFAKRWMWKFQHENGFVETNEVHIPAGKNVSFVMISQDVIHSFFLPSFRVKQDILPEIYTILSLQAKKTGDFPLFCAEYCGTEHSGMKGSVKVVSEDQYKKTIGLSSIKIADRGEKIFQRHNCVSCHHDGSSIAPHLDGTKDDNFIRRAILYPQIDTLKGFSAVMPSYKDQINEEEMRHLIEYIKKLGKKNG